MFAKISKDISYYSWRKEWIWDLNEENILNIKRSKIRSMEKKNKKFENAFNEFKYLIMWRWVKVNTELNEKFINNFHKVVKKLKITLTPKEEDFINDIEEFVFSTWRPLKTLNVKFELEPKEVVSLFQSNVNFFNWDPKKEKALMVGKYNTYYSNQRIIFCDKEQNIVFTLKNSSIENAAINNIGVLISSKRTMHILKGDNKYLSYIFLQNMIPELNLDYNKVIDYYKSYSMTDTILEIFN